MIKKLFLKYKSKSSSGEKEHTTYSNGKNFGILYNQQEFDQGSISILEEILKNDDKIVSMMGFCQEITEDSSLYSKKDISPTGSIKKELLTFFVDQPFDFLISLDTAENENYKYILAKSKAICKVGFEAAEYEELLQLALKKDLDDHTAIRNLAKYLKMI